MIFKRNSPIRGKEFDPNRLSIVVGQQWLAVLWLGGTFLAMLILVGETYGNVWGSVAPEAWGWFLPMVIPTLTLIVSSVVAEVTKETPSTASVTMLAFWLSFGVSLSYLLFVVLALVIAALYDPPILALKMSSLWLSSLQALVGILIGVFFGGRKPQTGAGEKAETGAEPKTATENGRTENAGRERN